MQKRKKNRIKKKAKKCALCVTKHALKELTYFIVNWGLVFGGTYLLQPFGSVVGAGIVSLIAVRGLKRSAGLVASMVSKKIEEKVDLAAKPLMEDDVEFEIEEEKKENEKENGNKYKNVAPQQALQVPQRALHLLKPAMAPAPQLVPAQQPAAPAPQPIIAPILQPAAPPPQPAIAPIPQQPVLFAVPQARIPAPKPIPPAPPQDPVLNDYERRRNTLLEQREEALRLKDGPRLRAIISELNRL